MLSLSLQPSWGPWSSPQHQPCPLDQAPGPGPGLCCWGLCLELWSFLSSLHLLPNATSATDTSPATSTAGCQRQGRASARRWVKMRMMMASLRTITFSLGPVGWERRVAGTTSPSEPLSLEAPLPSCPTALGWQVLHGGCGTSGTEVARV